MIDLDKYPDKSSSGLDKLHCIYICTCIMIYHTDSYKINNLNINYYAIYNLCLFFSDNL